MLKAYTQNYVYSWKIANFYIVYKINKNGNTSSNGAVNLLGGVSLTKHVNIDSFKYSGYGIGLDRHGSYSYSSGWAGRNVIVFRVDMSSSTKIN